MKLKYTIEFLLIFMMIEETFQDSCSSVVNPTSYKECSPFFNNQTQTICCWVSGVYGDNNGTACISMDSLFSGKIVSYTLSGLTSVMTCGDLTTSSNFLNIKFYPIALFLFLMYILV
jgi:hypothetical protein